MAAFRSSIAPMLLDSQLSQGLAIIGAPQGFFVAHGPFTRAAKPVAGSSWLYWSDFENRNTHPWLRPTAARFCSRHEIIRDFMPLSSEAPRVQWQKLENTAFERDFSRLQQDIVNGRLEKAVPTVVEMGSFTGAPLAFFKYLLGRVLTRATPELFPYFIVDGEKALVGLSPEILFESEDGHRYQSHALASTQNRGQRPAEEFLKLSKEAWEHELVVRGILSDLKIAGATSVDMGARKVRQLPTLEHLETPIAFNFSSGAAELLSCMHPSPALGVYPKNDANLALLQNLEASRERQSHGAPVGYLDQDTGACRFIVGIRCLQVEGNRVQLAAGCGVTRDSESALEWRELAAKRASVKRLLLDDQGQLPL